MLIKLLVWSKNTAHNKDTLRRLRQQVGDGGSGYKNRQSGVRWALERPLSGLIRHILQALQTLRVCLFGLAKRRIPFRVRQHISIFFQKKQLTI
jgi:hypothetical protein